MKSFSIAIPVLIASIHAPTAARAAQDGLEDPIPRPIRVAGPPLRLETVATGMTAPNWGTAAPGLPDHLFVTDQIGIVWSVDLDSGAKTAFLDVTDEIVTLGIGGPGTFDERGLLGLAFHPDYATNGRLYTYTSQPAEGAPDFAVPLGDPANHESVVTEWQVPDPSDPNGPVDPDSARELMRIGEPQFNHNAGALVFGPDGMLYITLGDGGNADDQGPGHVRGGNGQFTGNVLGKLLRIDPLGNDSANGQYGIPEDNPFFPGGVGPFGGDAGCVDGSCDEIFAYGMRNPFRFSFDRATGDLFLADVGQNDLEEVNVVIAGGNYGWRTKEGSFCFDPNGDEDGFVLDPSACSQVGLIDPIAEYDHDEGLAVVGGFVYRGSDIPFLRGRYVFGEYTDPETGLGRLLFLGKKNLWIGDTSQVSEVRITGAPLDAFVLGFGEDARGEVYVLSNETGVPFEETGTVRKITAGH